MSEVRSRGDDMDWTRPVDIYCERLGPGLLAEPINALTNLAFFLAAFVGWRAAERAGRLDVWTKALCVLVALVGLGSLLFHTFAQAWSGAADVLAILLFIILYLGLSLWRYFGARPLEGVAGAVAFPFFASGVRGAAGATLPAALQPATGYLPALLALGVLGGLLALRRHPVGLWLVGAAALFALSLTFRSLDMSLCETWPLGTHFMWHLLNATLLGLLLLAYVRHADWKGREAV
jgi:hypothetical protein